MGTKQRCGDYDRQGEARGETGLPLTQTSGLGRRWAGVTLRVVEYYAIFLIGSLLHTARDKNAFILGGLCGIVGLLCAAEHLLRLRPKTSLVRGLLIRLLMLSLPTFLLIWSGGEIRSSERIRLNVAGANLRNIRVVVEDYKTSKGLYPLQLSEITEWLPQGMLRDPYGETYLYQRLGEERAVIYSRGPDRDDDGAQRVLPKHFQWYTKGAPPFWLMPRFLYNLCYESSLVDGDICLFLPTEKQGLTESKRAKRPDSKPDLTSESENREIGKRNERK